MFLGLRHRAIRRCHHQDRAIYLRRPGDHVLDIVTVTRHVHVRVVPVLCLVFHMRNVDRDPARFLFRRVVDLIVRPKIRSPKELAVLGDRRGQRRLPVVDVSHRTDVQMWFAPVKFLLRHVSSPWSHIIILIRH